jgi:flagellin-like protein
MNTPTDRGTSSVVGTALLVAVVVVVAAGTMAYLTPIADDLHEPPQLALSVEETTITTGAEYCSAYGTNKEIAFEVTLTQFTQADEIYVIVHEEGGKTKKTVWADPGPDDVGTSKLLANEVTSGPVDVDLGQDGGSDIKICPGEDLTLRFYAKQDGETLALQRYDMN